MTKTAVSGVLVTHRSATGRQVHEAKRAYGMPVSTVAVSSPAELNSFRIKSSAKIVQMGSADTDECNQTYREAVARRDQARLKEQDALTKTYTHVIFVHHHDLGTKDGVIAEHQLPMDTTLVICSGDFIPMTALTSETKVVMTKLADEDDDIYERASNLRSKIAKMIPDVKGPIASAVEHPLEGTW